MSYTNAHFPISLNTEAERAALLDGIVYAYARQPEIRREAQRILARAGVRTPDPDQTARAIFGYVQKSFPYVLEAGEAFETPAYSIRNLELGGDCDAHALLIAALLESVGVPAQMVYWRAPGTKFATHVSAAYWNGRHWTNADSTQTHSLGWAPATHTYKMGASKNGAAERSGFELIQRADTLPPARLPGMPPLGIIGWIKNKVKKLYRAAKKLGGAVLEAGADLMRSAADLLGEIPLIGEALEAIADAIIDGAESFVRGFVSVLETIGGVVADVLGAVASKLVEWAKDWKTWGRLALFMISCAGGAALAGAATGGAGAVVVVSSCASSWASMELTVMSMDVGTEKFEELTGIDIPDVLEPANLKRLIDSGGLDWESLGDVAWEDLADAAETYALAEVDRQIESIPGRIGDEVKRRAMDKLSDIPGFNALPAAAKSSIRQAIETRGESINNLGSEARAYARAAREGVEDIPPFDELAPELREALNEEMQKAKRSVPGLNEAAEALEAQISDIAVARSAATSRIMEELAPGQGYQVAAAKIAELDVEINRMYVKPIADEVFTQADLAEMLPLSTTELAVFRREGRWTGDTGSVLMTTGRVTKEQTIFQGGEIGDPLSGAKAALRYRAKGIAANNQFFNALASSGLEIPLVTTRSRVVRFAQGAEPETSVLGPMLAAGAAAAMVAAWKV